MHYIQLYKQCSASSMKLTYPMDTENKDMKTDLHLYSEQVIMLNWIWTTKLTIGASDSLGQGSLQRWSITSIYYTSGLIPCLSWMEFVGDGECVCMSKCGWEHVCVTPVLKIWKWYVLCLWWKMILNSLLSYSWFMAVKGHFRSTEVKAWMP